VRVIFCQSFFTLEISYYIVAANCKAAEFAGREIEQREDHGYVPDVLGPSQLDARRAGTRIFKCLASACLQINQ
jgi:hypothetical protein